MMFLIALIYSWIFIFHFSLSTLTQTAKRRIFIDSSSGNIIDFTVENVSKEMKWTSFCVAIIK